MKQKIILKVPMTCDKCRTKALKVAAVAHGVDSVAIEGDDKDRLVVTGEGVDSADLAAALRKKFRSASIVSVEEVKPPKEKPTSPATFKSSCQYPPPLYICERVDPYPDNCLIM